MILHWLDFLDTLPDRQVRYTIPELKKAVAVWDKQIRAQVLKASFTEGVDAVPCKKLEESNPDLCLVKLRTKAAYLAEGASMKNCVGSYFNRHLTSVYSLRSKVEEKSTATIEVRHLFTGVNRIVDRKIVQVRGPSNSMVSGDIAALMYVIAREVGFSLQGPEVFMPGEDDEEGEEW